jgi:hypothetical protein
MIIKRPLNSHRLRSALPRGFGWIDHRFLTDGYLARLSPPALSLYCLLICASDCQGLSFYSDKRLRDLLALDSVALVRARRELIDSGLVAYQKPLCQVLALERANGPLLPPRVVLPPPTPTPPPQPKPVEAHRPALPIGLNLRAMVEASLREGGVL